jgi:hypothetical protein
MKYFFNGASTQSKRFSMSSNTTLKSQKHQLALKSFGFRPTQIWVPDTKSSEFFEECFRQSALTAETDRTDKQLIRFLDDSLADLDNA